MNICFVWWVTDHILSFYPLSIFLGKQLDTYCLGFNAIFSGSWIEDTYLAWQSSTTLNNIDKGGLNITEARGGKWGTPVLKTNVF